MGCGDTGNERGGSLPNGFEQKYLLETKIASSNDVDIWRVKHKVSGDTFAVKVVRKALLKEDDTAVKDLFAEKDILLCLDSPFILKGYEAYEDEGTYFLVLEYLEGKNLLDYLETSFRTELTEQVVAGYLTQILNALSHCHFQEVIHGDLRCSNVVFADAERKTLKLIDFKPADSIDLNAACYQDIYRAPGYLAPEVVKTKECTIKADIWSCGILAYYMYSGELPYNLNDRSSLKELLEQIANVKFTEASLKGGVWDKVSVEGKKFLLSMLDTDPEKRPSADELLAEKWLSNTITTPLYDKQATKNTGSKKSTISYADQKFQKAMMNYVINRSSMELHRTSLVESFTAMDTSGDQMLSRDELRIGFRDMGIVLKDDEFEELFKQIDVDSNGQISLTEYLNATITCDLLDKDIQLEAAFKFLANNNTAMQRSVLSDAMNKGWLGRINMNSLFDGLYNGKSTEITYVDFSKAMKSVALNKDVIKMAKKS